MYSVIVLYTGLGFRKLNEGFLVVESLCNVVIGVQLKGLRKLEYIFARPSMYSSRLTGMAIIFSVGS